MTEDWLTSTAIAIVGKRGSGKTALAYDTCDKLHVSGRDIYVFKNPKPWTVTDRGWKDMKRLEDLYALQNAVVWIDEPQLLIPTSDRRSTEGLQRLFSIARHRDLTLLISTCETRWITRAVESYIDVWMVKNIDATLVKQGSIIAKIIKRFCVVDMSEFHLEPNEYLMYAQDFRELDGRHEFELPGYWTEDHSKPYALTTATSAVKLRTTKEFLEARTAPKVTTNGVR